MKKICPINNDIYIYLLIKVVFFYYVFKLNKIFILFPYINNINKNGNTFLFLSENSD